jgi:hypothetical protein
VDCVCLVVVFLSDVATVGLSWQPLTDKGGMIRAESGIFICFFTHAASGVVG